MWEAVAGLVVEADAPKIRVLDQVEFVGNWEREPEPAATRVIELN
jgi:hypothetical protein